MSYSKTAIQAIKAEVKKRFGPKARCHHIRPRAYCVAKPASWCAVFATPPCDAEPQVKAPNNTSDLIQNKSVGDVQVGDWCSLAYVSTATGGESHVIFKL